MNTAICAIAKNENLYINDWVKYHIDLGISKIFLFDNNDLDTPYVGNFINKSYKSNVYILPVNHFSQFQKQAYNDYYKYFGYRFNWSFFIDIDEFIVLPKYNNVTKFCEALPNMNMVRLNWQLYGDDGIIHGNVNVPIYKRIKRKLDHTYNYHAKCMLRGGLSNVDFVSVHYALINDKMPGQILPNGKRLSPDEKIVLNSIDYSNAYLAHYMTKTWDEFKQQKLGRSDAALKRTLNMDYFFRINPSTKNKLSASELRI